MPNDATNFAESRAENFRDVFLGSFGGHFSRDVTFRRKGQPARTITVLWREQQSSQATGQTTDAVGRVVVTCTNDPVTGIETPQEGDVLVYGELRYTFMGSIESQREGAWQLVFTRRKTDIVGGRFRGANG